MEEFISQGLPLLPAPDAQGLGASLAHLAANTTSAKQQLQQERQRREAAEAATAQLMEQMDEVAAQLFSFRSGRQQPPQQQQVLPSDLCASNGCSSSGNSPAVDVAALARAVLADAEAALAAERRRADTALAAAAAASTAAEGAAADAALVARMVASMLARAAAAEDLGAAWRADKALLERRLERAAAMGQAVLKHRTGQSAGGRQGMLGWHRRRGLAGMLVRWMQASGSLAALFMGAQAAWAANMCLTGEAVTQHAHIDPALQQLCRAVCHPLCALAPCLLPFCLQRRSRGGSSC